jgi:hypothetical protein
MKPGLALGKRSPHPRHPRSVAPLPQRERLLAFRLLPLAPLLPPPLLQSQLTTAVSAPLRPDYSGHRTSEGATQGIVLRASYLRKVPLENRVGLRVQGSARSRSAGRGVRGHRPSHLPAEGSLRLGTPPGEDPGWPAGPEIPTNLSRFLADSQPALTYRC